MARFLMVFVMGLMSLPSWALRDPTMPVNGKVTLSSPTVAAVDMILISEGRKVAVINGDFRSIGDTVGGNKILDIMPNYVVLENIKTGKRSNAPLSSRDVKVNAQ